ncbi:DNA methyltransferase [Thiohalocapsa halophila]|uniref:DNA methyltransferase n=1 Tax=Thiohalocapsa halophila TaxID=69359 RepID=UPI00190479A7
MARNAASSRASPEAGTPSDRSIHRALTGTQPGASRSPATLRIGATQANAGPPHLRTESDAPDDRSQTAPPCARPQAVANPIHRNRRSVWSISTKPYSGAHFAVFLPELIEPCILVSTQRGETVFDPFFGSGATGEVAQRLGRRWIGCELNQEYAELQKQRTAQTGLDL